MIPVGYVTSNQIDIKDYTETYYVHPLFFDDFLNNPYRYLIPIIQSGANVGTIQKTTTAVVTLDTINDLHQMRVPHVYRPLISNLNPIVSNLSYTSNLRNVFPHEPADSSGIKVYTFKEVPDTLYGFDYNENFSIRVNVAGEDYNTNGVFVVFHDKNKSLVTLLWNFEQINYQVIQSNPAQIIQNILDDLPYYAGGISSGLIGTIYPYSDALVHLRITSPSETYEVPTEPKIFPVYNERPLDQLENVFKGFNPNGIPVRETIRVQREYVISKKAPYTVSLIRPSETKEYQKFPIFVVDDESLTLSEIATKTDSSINDIKVLNGISATPPTGKEVLTLPSQAKQSANQSSSSNSKITNSSLPSNEKTSQVLKEVVWEKETIKKGQIGIIQIVKKMPILTFSNNKFKTIKDAVVNYKYPVFEVRNIPFRNVTLSNVTHAVSTVYRISNENNVSSRYFLYNLGSEFSRFTAIPDELIQQTVTPETTSYTPPNVVNNTKDAIFIPHQNATVRPVLQIDKNGSKVTMGLRVTNIQVVYSNQFIPTITNAGWYIHAGSAALPVITLSGFFLDTQDNQEFDTFMSNYKKYVTAYRDGNFYSSAICNFFYREKEYACLISNFSYSKAEGEYLFQRFTMQLLVLRERGFVTGVNAASTPVNTKLKNDETFFSDLQNMLYNPINSY